MIDYDLHCHSNVSDGTLTPTELVERAAGRGVTVLALTDHDDVDGLDEARAAAARQGIAFVNGVEVFSYSPTEPIANVGPSRRSGTRERRWGARVWRHLDACAFRPVCAHCNARTG